VRPRGRSLLLVAVVLYLLATVVWVGAERRSPRQFLAAGSALNDGERGVSLARQYLAARPGPPGAPGVGLLERPISTTELPPDAVVFRLEPEVLPWQPARSEVPEPKKKTPAKKGTEKKGTEKKAPMPPPPPPKKPPEGVTDPSGEEDEKSGNEDDDGGPLSAALPAKHAGRSAPLLTADEEEWVRGGGRLVLGISRGSGEAGEYGPVWAEREKALRPEPLVKVFPLWPEVETLRLVNRQVLRGPGLGRTHAVFLAGEAPVVARLPLGRGDVVLLSCPDIFHNARLAVADHLALLGALAGGPSGPAGRAVYFDELTHGIGASTGLLTQLTRWGLGPALLLAGLAALGLVYRQAVRIGPPERGPPDARSEAVDLVDSLGELYDRALSRGAALRLYWEGFVHTVAVDAGLTGLAGPALEARARELAGGFAPPPGDVSREGFEQALTALNSARRRARDGKYDRPHGDG
jgi:hypothetical protein